MRWEKQVGVPLEQWRQKEAAAELHAGRKKRAGSASFSVRDTVPKGTHNHFNTWGFDPIHYFPKFITGGTDTSHAQMDNDWQTLERGEAGISGQNTKQGSTSEVRYKNLSGAMRKAKIQGNGRVRIRVGDQHKKDVYIQTKSIQKSVRNKRQKGV